MCCRGGKSFYSSTLVAFLAESFPDNPITSSHKWGDEYGVMNNLFRDMPIWGDAKCIHGYAWLTNGHAPHCKPSLTNWIWWTHCGLMSTPVVKSGGLVMINKHPHSLQKRFDKINHDDESDTLWKSYWSINVTECQKGVMCSCPPSVRPSKNVFKH